MMNGRETISIQDKTAIVMLDLNNLKKCNDRYGHEAGDTYLKKASEMITNAFSQENTVYRIGGDEFCVIMRMQRKIA